MSFYTSDETVVRCPNCNSENTSIGYTIHRQWDVWFLVFSTLTMTPFFPIRKKHHCFNCGANFTKHEAVEAETKRKRSSN